MAKAAIQTAAKSLNGMTLGSGLAIGGLALGLGGWQLGSAIDKATDHSYRALLAAEHWGARIDKIDVKEWGRRADEAAASWQGAGAELRRQSDLWRETTEKAAEASYAIGALLLRLLDGVEVDCLISAQVACRRALELAAGARAERKWRGARRRASSPRLGTGIGGGRHRGPVRGAVAHRRGPDVGTTGLIHVKFTPPRRRREAVSS